MATIFTCTQDGLVNDAKDYRVPVITAHARKALTAYAKVLALSGGGTDYTSNYPLLFSDAIQATKGIDRDALAAAALNMEFLKAANTQVAAVGGVSAGAAISDKLLAAKALLAQPDEILDRVILYLDCAFNAAVYNS